MNTRIHRWQGRLSGYPVTFEYLAVYLLAAYDVVAVANLLGLAIPFVQPVLWFLLVGFALGGLFLLHLGIEPEVRARWMGYALGSGMVILLVAGICLTAGLPYLGYDRPLSPVPLLLTLNALFGVLLGMARRRGLSASIGLRDAVTSLDWRPSVVVVLSIPLWTTLSMTFLNVTNVKVPIIGVLLLLSVIPIYVVVYGLDQRYHPLALASMAFAILLHKNLWLADSYGGHTSVVAIWKSGIWTFSGESLAINAVLMPAFGHLSGVHILTFMAILFPLLVAFVPVGMWISFEEYTDPKTAFLGATAFVFSHPYYFQYPDNPRAAMPVLFMVFLGMVISDHDNARFQRSILAVLFGFGIITSHYGTSYYVMFALVGALFVMWGYGLVERLLQWLLELRSLVREWIGADEHSVLDTDRPRVLTNSFVGYYVSAVIGYYYFVDDGSVYELLIQHVLSAYVDLFLSTDDSGGGATATRLTADYGGVSIDYSKHLYVLFAMLMAVGLVVVHWDRIAPWRRSEFDDDFLAFSSLLVFLFGGTIVISGEWGGGRPMMVVFSFTTVFAVLGTSWITRTLQRIVSGVAERLDRDLQSTVDDAALAGRAAFAILLATFFVLNSGTVAALAYGGEAPSEVPSTDLTELTQDTDVAAHAFVTDYRSLHETIYGDRGTREEATDWLNGEIDSETERDPYRFRRTNDFSEVNGSELESGYLILTGHNVVDEMVDVDFVTDRPIELYDLGREDRHRVYTNGKATVYYTDQTAQHVRETRNEDEDR